VLISSLTVVLGCHRVVSGVEPESLAYGPAQPSLLASGYDSDPVPRATPTPWTPPDRSGSSTLVEPGAVLQATGVLGELEPVAFTSDIIRVCEHLAKQGSTSGSAKADAVCLRHYRIAQVFRTIGDWKTLVACLVATTDDPGIATCTRATPASVAVSVDHPRESGVCMHLFALSIVEELGPDPMLDAVRLAEFETLVSSCVDSLVTDERPARGPSQYMAMLECVEVAPTTAVAELCAGPD
jgi:hypothetical protein